MSSVQRDASDSLVTVPSAPSRIVSLVPSVTETLFALGLGDRVVGVTEWCIHPARELASVPRVRGTKNPDVAAIESLRPDLVLANLEENREIDVRRLRERGFAVWVDFPCTVADVVAHVEWLADLGAPEGRRSSLLGNLEQGLATARARLREPRRCFVAVWKDPWMTLSRATYAHDLLAHLGLANVFADAAERYPRVTLDRVASLSPEVVLLPDEPYRFGPDDARALAEGPLAGTPAARNGAIRVVDGTLAFWPGPRTARALAEGL
ncbi:MAG: ABC transporter substrate-binding protein [Deltaproteobacteria bacterium]|nr:ABC transporter substrate-binding protein [Deltaproteobacteria bacterium]